MKSTVAMVFGLVLLSACASKPVLLRHYQQNAGEMTISEEVNLSVFVAGIKPSESTPLILGLAERGQAELVRSLSAKVPADGSDRLLKLLQETGDTASKPCAWANKASMSKRLVFTVLGPLAKPADRIDRLDFVLELPATGSAQQIAFTSWDKFDSASASYDIGSAKFTQSDKISVKPAGSTGIAKVVDFGYEQSNELEESAKYALRRLTIGGALSSNRLQLTQEGGPNLTLSGSSSATITFRVFSSADVQPVHALQLFQAGVPLPSAKVSVERCLSKYPKTDTPVVAAVSGNALLRVVTAGGETVSEGDDQVIFNNRPLSKSEITLATQEELHVDLFGLIQCAPRDSLDACKRVMIEDTDGPTRAVIPLMFPSAAAAAELRQWLVQSSVGNKVSTMASKQLGVATLTAATPAELDPISSEVASNLQVARLHTNTPSPKAK